MRILELVQGSPEWKAAREKYRTASEASAALGLSKYKSRADLLLEKSVGAVDEDVPPAKQALFDKGHAAEASARPIAERIVGEELFPATGVDDDDYMLASFDGLTMLGDITWEHKLINADLRDADEETLDEHYKIQLDHQLAVSGAEKCLFMASDGTEEDCNWFWYYRDEERIAAVNRGWDQFEKDLEEYTPTVATPEAEAAPVEAFPALFIDIEGDVKESNLATYQQAVTARIEAINTDLQTDQDFADAEGMVKFLEKAEKEVEGAKKQALAKTASIDTLIRTVDHLRESMRAKRLELDKLVKARKKEMKIAIAQGGRNKVDSVINKANARLGEPLIPDIPTDFNGAMKGKRLLETLQGAADDEAARACIEVTRWEELIAANMETLEAAGNAPLFPDRKQILLKAPEDLAAIIKARIAEHEAAEAAKRQREEDERKSREEAQAKAKPEDQSRADDSEPPKPAADAPLSIPAACTAVELTEYDRGYLDGLARYAYWEDGVQYVGRSPGVRIDKAVEDYLAKKAAA